MTTSYLDMKFGCLEKPKFWRQYLFFVLFFLMGAQYFYGAYSKTTQYEIEKKMWSGEELINVLYKKKRV